MEDFCREALALCIDDIRNGGSERSPLSLSLDLLDTTMFNLPPLLVMAIIFGIIQVHAFQHHPSVLIGRQLPNSKPFIYRRFTHHDIPAHHNPMQLQMSNNKNSEVKAQQSSIPLISILGLLSQPIVWSSLYLVRTTGGGYPAGPFGLLAPGVDPCTSPRTSSSTWVLQRRYLHA